VLFVKLPGELRMKDIYENACFFREGSRWAGVVLFAKVN